MPVHHSEGTQRRFVVGVGQFKPTKGRYERNLEQIGLLMRQSLQEGVDVLVLPETATTGYFLEGGVRELAMPASQLLGDLARLYADLQPNRPLDICVGFYEYLDGEYFNSALYATLEPKPTQSRILHVHQKFFLPTYGVFEEERFVARGRRLEVFPTRFGRAAILICEDVWHSVTSTIVALKGAQVIYVPTASPARGFHTEQIENVETYRRMLTQIASEHTVYVVQSSLVGFEGGKGFVGASWIVNPFGKPMAQGPINQEALLVVPLDLDDIAIARAQLPLLSDLRSVIADLALQFERLARSEAL